MKILAIETSCDETAVAVVEAEGEIGNASFSVLGNALFSQIEIHKEYGGVFPALAKREHGKNLVPILRAALTEANLLHANYEPLIEEQKHNIEKLLEREGELAFQLIEFLEEVEVPKVDAIAVTHGPGLEPTLWVGINFARALSGAWSASRRIPIVPVNHMEGHILSSVFFEEKIKDVPLPAIALLISGGHTELVLMKDWLSYELIGETQDDAVGEAFDKVARMMELPYPGGPEISKLAESAREKSAQLDTPLPRPMLHSDDCNFSFSGLKTAVLYALKKTELTQDEKEKFAREFEDAVSDVLIKKTKSAIEETGAKALIIGGGVAANKEIRKRFENEVAEIKLYLPDVSLTGDNAVMIALAGFFRYKNGDTALPGAIVADGTLKLPS
ncbi:MAG: tRNA (adenosine(37)-N6)-threonylcarbamoyltransferase complex transferase subunit TsaD [Candidatus Paceibacterota bacterium]